MKKSPTGRLENQPGQFQQEDAALSAIAAPAAGVTWR
ncbi:hypothetical protein GGD87_001107 [Rhodobaca bogoriensis DSM 18756]|nr:hypothetical protein [Rhodobaca bogoriensis DSM 18756]